MDGADVRLMRTDDVLYLASIQRFQEHVGTFRRTVHCPLIYVDNVPRCQKQCVSASPAQFTVRHTTTKMHKFPYTLKPDKCKQIKIQTQNLN